MEAQINHEISQQPPEHELDNKTHDPQPLLTSKKIRFFLDFNT